MTTITNEEQTEFKARSVTLQNTAWEYLRKSETAYELGNWKLALELDVVYCRLTKDSIYFAQLSYSKVV